jgi:hypothetical protein
MGLDTMPDELVLESSIDSSKEDAYKKLQEEYEGLKSRYETNKAESFEMTDKLNEREEKKALLQKQIESLERQ